MVRLFVYEALDIDRNETLSMMIYHQKYSYS